MFHACTRFIHETSTACSPARITPLVHQCTSARNASKKCRLVPFSRGFGERFRPRNSRRRSVQRNGLLASCIRVGSANRLCPESRKSATSTHSVCTPLQASPGGNERGMDHRESSARGGSERWSPGFSRSRYFRGRSPARVQGLKPPLNSLLERPDPKQNGVGPRQVLDASSGRAT